MTSVFIVSYRNWYNNIMKYAHANELIINSTLNGNELNLGYFTMETRANAEEQLKSFVFKKRALA